MIDLLTIENIGSLLILIFLQAVLGFDNLLYISIESQRAPQHAQKRVRFWGIIIAVALRVILLFVMIHLIEKLKTPFHVFKIEVLLRVELILRVLFFYLEVFLLSIQLSRKLTTSCQRNILVFLTMKKIKSQPFKLYF